tara:strand:+ start:659 stop:1873 length:1215 start_codon:yes stop_codon:yes gene_type:complete
MIVSILTIGNELLSGKTINTNASWISNKLSLTGVSVNSHLTIPDDKNRITDTLNLLFSSDIDLIICTGGLGVTDDDITRAVIFDYFGSKEVFDEDYWEDLCKRFSKLGQSLPDSSKNQAISPDNGILLPNHIGSARGLMYEKNKIILIILPGVHSEMKSMMNQVVLPIVEKKIKSKISSINIRTTGLPESVIFEKIRNSVQEEEFVNVGYYPSVYGVDIRLSGYDVKKLERLNISINEHLKKYVYDNGYKNIEDIVIDNLNKENLTLSTAESCTGGLIGHRLTEVSGSSSVYYGGIISYSNKSKIDQLNVNPDNIKNFGAVSEEVAIEMAQNVKEKFNSSIGVSVTGIAGPNGGSEAKPVGLVYVGYCDEKLSFVHEFNFSSNREANKIRTSQAVLKLILNNNY